MQLRIHVSLAILVALSLAGPALTAAAQADRLQSSDYYRLRSVGEVQISPDGARIAYTVINYDRPGRPYSQLWILDVATGRSSRVGSEQDEGSSPAWSPDSQ
jgi:Tol biopolymer transport system component